MQNPVNLLPLAQFAQQVKAAELAQQREIKMPIQQAKLLALALLELQTKLLQDIQASLVKTSDAISNSSNVNVDGGSF